MTVSVLQQRQSSAAAASASIALAFAGAVTAGSTLVVFVSCDSSTGETISGCSDSVNGSYGAAVDLVNDTTNHDQVASFRFVNTGAGTPTVTVSFTGTPGSRSIWIFEVGGAATSASLDGHTGQNQASPGTGTDATTSGNATNTKQPVLLIGLSYNTSTTNPPAAGTAFTDHLTGWDFGVAVTTRAESKRVTTIGNQAATFTATAGTDRYISMVVVIDEAGASSSDDRFAWPKYPAHVPGFHAGPEALNWPWVKFSPDTTQAAPTDTTFIFPTYQRGIARVGPTVLRSPNRFLLQHLLAPVTNTEFVFPTYRRGGRVGPEAQRRPLRAPLLLDVLPPGAFVLVLPAGYSGRDSYAGAIAIVATIVHAGKASAETRGADAVSAALGVAGATSSEGRGSSVGLKLSLPGGASSASTGGAVALAGTLRPAGGATAEARGAGLGKPSLAPAGGSSSAAAGAVADRATETLAGAVSREVRGAQALSATVAPAGKGSAESHGALVDLVTNFVLPGGGTSAERHGATTILAALRPSGLATGETRGAVVPSPTPAPAGGRTGEQRGAPRFIGVVALAGLTSSERRGAIVPGSALLAVGPRSSESHGPITLLATQVVQAAGSGSAERHGAASVLVATSLAGGQTFEAHGAPLANLVRILSFAGAASFEAHGATVTKLIVFGPVSADRIIVIAADGRVLSVAFDDRSAISSADTRTASVPFDDRTEVAPRDPRNLNVKKDS